MTVNLSVTDIRFDADVGIIVALAEVSDLVGKDAYCYITAETPTVRAHPPRIIVADQHVVLTSEGVAINPGILPPNLSFVDRGDGFAFIKGVPAKGSAGDYLLTVVASNAAGESRHKFLLRIKDEPHL